MFGFIHRLFTTKKSHVTIEEATSSICDICNISHTELIAPGIAAPTCNSKKCIHAHTTHMLKTQYTRDNITHCPYCDDVFSRTLLGNLPMCIKTDCIDQLESDYAVRKHHRELQSFVAKRGRVICDMCSHSFPPSENYRTHLDANFPHPEKVSDYLCYDCAFITFRNDNHSDVYYSECYTDYS